MKLRSHLLIWLGIFAFFLLSVYALKAILLPFVVALLVAYFLDPVADRLERVGCSRTVATLIIVSGFFAVLIALGLALLPILYEQSVAFMHAVPGYISGVKDTLLPFAHELLGKLDSDALGKAEGALRDASGNILSFAVNFLANIWESSLTIINLLSLIFITPVVAFYSLRDWDKMVAKLDHFLPRHSAPTIRKQLHLMNLAVAGYVRGQTSVCLVLGTFYAIALSFAGLEFGLFIGLGTGLLTFIPYVGMLVGMTCGLIVAYFQFGTLSHVAFILGIFVLGNILEGNFVAPKLVGDKVGLHPVWIIFGLLAGGALFGFIGVLIAVPVTAILGVLVRFTLQEYLHSPLYGKTAHVKKVRRRA